MSPPPPSTGANVGTPREPKLRFGIICSDELDAWQLEAIKYLVDQGDATLAVIVHTPCEAPPARRRLRLRSERIWSGGMKFLLRRSRAIHRVRIASAFGDTRIVSSDKVPDIRAEQLAFLLDFGHHSIPDDMYAAASHGVWAFAHGVETTLGDIPSGFWEILNDELVSAAFLLQRFSPSVSPRILKHGCYKTISYSYARSVDDVYFGSARWPAYVVSAIRNGIVPYDERALETLAVPSARRPSNVDLLRFLFMLAGNQRRRIFLYLHTETWNVGAAAITPAQLLAGAAIPSVIWMPVVQDQWVADPMTMIFDGKLHVLCERWTKATNRGSIVRTTYDDGSWGALEPAIEAGFHLSYPFLFAADGQIYCVPESVAANEVHLYRAASFPQSWVDEALLLSGPTAIDSTIFEHDGLWWLFCSSNDADNVLLYAYFANVPTGPWQPHLANPVKIDIRGSRPAGPLFFDAGRLYRPAQDCSKTYGGRIVIYRIDELTPSAFRESLVAAVEPDPTGPYRDGLHTICAGSSVCVLDGKRWERIGLIGVFRRLGSALRR